MKHLNIDSDVRISEPEPGDQNTVDLTFNVPISFKLCGKRPLDEYKEITLEHIGHKISALFRLIDYLGHQHDQDNILSIYFAEFAQHLSQLGNALQETFEIVNNSFERYEKSSPFTVHSKEPIEELISRVLKHPQVTSGLNHAILQYVREFNKKQSDDLLEIESPEFIKASMKNEIHAEDETILDLSNHSTKKDECLDLAKHLSAVMLDKNTPINIFNALVDELVNQNVEPGVYYSPEYIASMICGEAKGKANE